MPRRQGLHWEEETEETLREEAIAQAKGLARPTSPLQPRGGARRGHWEGPGKERGGPLADRLPPELAALFPYPPRTGQARAATTVLQGLQEGRPIVMEAGTGTGKTVLVLAAAVAAARQRGLRVLYLTRTNSQQRQAMVELRAIRDASGAPLRAVALQGRSHLCPKLTPQEEFRGATSEELARVCSDLKTRTRLLLPPELGGLPTPGAAAPTLPQGAAGVPRPAGGSAQRSSPALPAAGHARLLPLVREQGCELYAGLLEAQEGEGLEAHFEAIPTSEEAAATLAAKGICPYEAAKARLATAEVVVAPYVYFFDAGLRRVLLSWMNVIPSEIVVCCDEAHNLPDHLRELGSVPLTLETLKRARAEARQERNPEIATGLPALAVLEEITLSVEALLAEHLGARPGEAGPHLKEDARLPPGALESELMARLQVASPRLRLAADGLLILGESIREKRRKARRLPRSYLHAVGGFLAAWLRSGSEATITLAARVPKPRLELYLLDPAGLAEPLMEAAGSVHFSGTLRPLAQYRDTLGLPATTLHLTVPSPFDPGNRETLIVQGVTTRFEEMQREPRMVDRLASLVESLAATSGANCGLFFPSYVMMRQFLDAGLRHVVARRVFVEEPGATQAALMRALSLFADEGRRAEAGGKGALLVSTMGGRISEGMDFPGAALEVVVLVGVPYARPSARSRALVAYYDAKCGRGWEYAVEAPAVRRYLQSLGRLIRSETDQGIALLLDERAVRWRHDMADPRIVTPEEALALTRGWIARRRGGGRRDR